MCVLSIINVIISSEFLFAVVTSLCVFINNKNLVKDCLVETANSNWRQMVQIEGLEILFQKKRGMFNSGEFSVPINCYFLSRSCYGFVPCSS